MTPIFTPRFEPVIDAAAARLREAAQAIQRADRAQPHPLRNKRVLLVGLGDTGLAVARWATLQGATVRVIDTREHPPGLVRLRELCPSAEIYVGQAIDQACWLDGVDRVIPAPGLSPHFGPLHGLLKLCAEQHVPVQVELDLFAEALDYLAQTRAYQPQVLGVTGTNGKTTVTALTAHLLRAAGCSVRHAGNISPAMLEALSESWLANDLPQVWVLELSSFQLALAERFRCRAGVVLNLTQDHLDWHDGMGDYAAAKQRLLERSEIAIVNRHDPLVVAMVENLEAKRVRSFGLDRPSLHGDLGLHPSAGMDWLAEAHAEEIEPAAQPTQISRRRKASTPEVRLPTAARLLMPAEVVPLAGRHNLMNVQAALLLARATGRSWAALLHAVRTYYGEPHRMQFVRQVGGVDCYNDSKGTNVGATVAALDGMTRPVVLIAGGQGKQQDFSPLCEPVRQRARAVVLLGIDRDLLAAALQSSGIPVYRVDSMQQAVSLGLSLAQVGDALLLSPACASLDQFRNYAHRGDVFTEAVQECALERGEFA